MSLRLWIPAVSLSLLLLYAASVLVFPPSTPSRFELSIRSPGASVEVAYSTTERFSLGDTISRQTKAGHIQHLVFELPARPIQRLRIRIADTAGVVKIYRACLRRVDAQQASLCWNPKEFYAQFHPLQDIASFTLGEDAVRIRSLGEYPLLVSHHLIASNLAGFLHGSRAPGLAVFVVLVLLSALFAFCLQRFFRQQRASKRIPYVVAKIACVLIAVGLFFWMSVSLGAVTPPLQGPDEEAHFSKLLSLQGEVPCGVLPAGLAKSNAVFAPLRQHPERQIDAEMLERAFVQSTERIKAPPTTENACAYNASYLLGTLLVNYLRGISYEEDAALAFLQQTRVSATLSTTALWGIALLLCLFGRVHGIGKRIVQSQRLVQLRVLLSVLVLYCMFVPQTLWLTAMLGHDASLLACAVLLSLGVFFHIPFLSTGIAAFSLYLAASKVVYLLPFGLSILLHYYYRPFFRLLRWANSVLHDSYLRGFCYLVLLIVIGYFTFWGMAYFACRYGDCYGLWDASLFHAPLLFFNELWILCSEFRVLTPPPFAFRDSAYFTFGWLDTRLDSYFTWLYTLPAMVVFVFLVLSNLCTRTNAPRDTYAITACTLVCILHLCAAVLASYLIFVIMQAWCGVGAGFGCGYQRRYDAPFLVYTLLPFYVMPLVWRKS